MKPATLFSVCAFARRVRHGPLPHGRAAPPLEQQPALVRQDAVRFGDGVEVNAEIARKLAHRGQPVARLQIPRDTKRPHPIGNLPIHRNRTVENDAEFHFEPLCILFAYKVQKVNIVLYGSMSRVLILKFGAIGDVIMAIPAAHQLHLQGHTIDWVCGHAVLPILELYPWINPIPIDDRALLKGGAPAKLKVLLDLWRRLAGRRYLLAATLYYDARYRFLTGPIRSDRKIQLSHTDRNLRLIPGRHHTDEFARILLNWPDQVRPQPLSPVAPPRLPPAPLPRTGKRRVVLAPAGAKNMMADDILRRWQPEHYVALTRLLLARDLEVVLIGGPGDAWIQPLFAAFPVADLIGKLTLPETLALLDEADVLVTHDTGPLHLAGITRAGVVGIFGPTDPRGRLPQRPGAVAIWGGEGFACRPCYDAHSFAPCPSNECMAEVTPALVLAEVEALFHSPQTPAHVVTPQPALTRITLTPEN